MFRYFEFLIIAAIVLTLLRTVILAIMTPIRRQALRRQFGWTAEKTVETQLTHWRSRTGRALWLNLVGIPIIIFFVLIFISRNG